MTRTTIRIGRVAIDGMSRAPARAAALSEQLERAIGSALREPAESSRRASGFSTSIPLLHVSLGASATDSDIARALADALRDVVARMR